MAGKEIDKKGRYSFIASIMSSVAISALFLALAFLKNSSRQEPLYSQVDIAAGMIFVFILAMIVSFSIWPSIVEKSLQKR